ncbi:MAG: hypothetical protein JSS02_06640 [Planctomycetes bacterium]|nr:hypothetical protein [Planctomycetota bacterium]
MTSQRVWLQFIAFLALLCSGLPTARAEEPANEPEIVQTSNSTLPTSGDEFNQLIDRAIRVTAQRKLTAGVHTPWQVVHGILAQRWDLSLVMKDNPKEEVSGIEWITSGVYFDGMPLWEATPYGGRGHPFTRPYAFEGHPTQFLGYMCMANIPLEYEVKTPTKIITVKDIINDAKMQVNGNYEITWTLWALAHYEEPDAQWFNAAGEPWSIERLVKLQVDEPVESGACGGCHGLFALAYARNMYLSTLPPGKKHLRGVWFEADQKIKRYVALAKSLQNADGSFSSEHFRGPGYSEDFATRITTSGHQLEWLMIALPQSKLNEEWFRRAIASVARDLINNRHVASDCGPLYHGMHALVIYRQRTVPGYLVPQFNSQIKLSDRGKKKPVVEESAKVVPPPYKSGKSVKISKNDSTQTDKNDAGNSSVPTDELTPPAATDASVTSGLDRVRR